jgi:AGZA family xanthine/uracil permease-like MFS transporter
MMPLTYSIANGIGLGFITYVLAKGLAGRYQDVNASIVALAAIFAIKFALPG